MDNSSGLVLGQHRSRSLRDTFQIALAAARGAGVTRLADVTGLTPFGIPVFQAVRPMSRSISVSQGKGLTPTAAKVSALLESFEMSVAERLTPPGELVPLRDLSDDAVGLWHGRPREAGAAQLDLAHGRHWLQGRCMFSGRPFPIPFDLISLDFTVKPAADAKPSSSGLATGNNISEAATAAVAELLERDLTALFETGTPQLRRELEIDIQSIDDSLIAPLLVRIGRAGFDARLWSIGQHWGIAAIRCVIVARGSTTELPPTAGSGCHPRREIAALRAILEAVQVYATLVAGARDDLTDAHYAAPDMRKLELMLRNLSFTRGSLTWRMVPDLFCKAPAACLEALLEVVLKRSSLPMIGLLHDSEVSELSVFRAVAPGLLDLSRAHEVRQVTVLAPRMPNRKRGPVVFVGPTLPGADIPTTVERLPPAVCGDLIALLSDPPTIVGLVDGCFGAAPSVWHKEILALVAMGIPVVGAASLGALRAAELVDHGMTGVGRIYESYRSGAISRDDAVMLVHAPGGLGWRPLTLTLVDAEAALAATPLDGFDRRMLQRIVRTLPYTVRTWPAVLREFTLRTGRRCSANADALTALATAKRDDALLLLEVLQDPAKVNLTTTSPPPVTSSLLSLLASVTPGPS